MMVLCTGLLVGCDKEEEYEPVKPPMEEPEKPNESVTPPSTDDIINTKIGDINMIVGTNDWNAVAYGNGKYVAVSGYYWGGKYEDAGYVTSSTDGKTWTTPKKLLSSNNEWKDVKFLNGKFVAAGREGCIATSVDGITWESYIAINKTIDWESVTYGNGLFVAAAYSGSYRAISTDCKNWVAGSSSGTSSFNDIAYGNGTFVIIGDYNTIKYTSDPYGNWGGISLGNVYNTYWTSIIYGNNKFVIVGYSYTNTTRTGWISTSTDGKTWTTPKSINDMWFRSVTYSSGKFIAAALYGYVTTSIDGVNWTTPEQIKDESGKVVTANLYGICAMP